MASDLARVTTGTASCGESAAGSPLSVAEISQFFDLYARVHQAIDDFCQAWRAAQPQTPGFSGTAPFPRDDGVLPYERGELSITYRYFPDQWAFSNYSPESIEFTLAEIFPEWGDALAVLNALG